MDKFKMLAMPSPWGQPTRPAETVVGNAQKERGLFVTNAATGATIARKHTPTVNGANDAVVGSFQPLPMPQPAEWSK